MGDDTDAVGHRIAAGDQLIFLHLGYAKGDLLGAHLRVRFANQLITGNGILKIAFPAFHRGFDECRYGRRALLDGVGHTDNRVAVGRVAPVAERIDVERLPPFGDGERLGGYVALLHQIFIRQERLNVEGIGAHFGVAQPQFALRPRPERGIGFGSEQEGFIF